MLSSESAAHTDESAQNQMSRDFRTDFHCILHPGPVLLTDGLVLTAHGESEDRTHCPTDTS